MKTLYKTNQLLTWLLKLLVVSLSGGVIFFAIKEVERSHWELLFHSSHFFNVVIVGISLSSLNWILEALKWKVLIKELRSISTLVAFSETLKAHAVSIITPNKIGEFGAKASFYPKALRSKVLKLTLTGQLYQLFATCCFGSVGLAFIYSRLQFDLKLSIGVILLLIIGSAILFQNLTFTYKWVNRLQVYLRSLVQINQLKNAIVFGLSVLRFICFNHQYFLLVWLFHPEVNYFQIMPILFSIYFISSFVPTFLILDASVKAGIGLVLLSPYVPSEVIIIASVLMWIFNFGIPAFAGNLLLLKPTRMRINLQNL